VKRAAAPGCSAEANPGRVTVIAAPTRVSSQEIFKRLSYAERLRLVKGSGARPKPVLPCSWKWV